MNTAPTGLDSLAAVLIVIIVLISLLTLLGMASLMAIGAMSSKRPLVTSWPNDQEQAFVPFEHRGAVSNTRAWAYSLIGATVLTVFAAGVYFGVTPDKKDIAKDMNMSNLTKKRSPAAPKPDPAKSDSAAPAEAPKPDPAAPSAPQQ
ncbi:MAG TPA: hypothetical protein VHN14_09320 [Kofleriaceae bacterium]|jgi:hypothetical protein|nr:hypothetical protein [Kofleriaceae bacterium]